MNFYCIEVPKYYLTKFKAVRKSTDNLHNALLVAEVINSCNLHASDSSIDDFDIAIFINEFKRFLIKKEGGYFSMSNPFQAIIDNDNLKLHCDFVGEEVSGSLISILRNAISTYEEGFFSSDDIILSLSESFNLDIPEANKYFDLFTYLLAFDHGYFRFDDDSDNENGQLHPRYHFDIFYRNSTSLKIGYDRPAEIQCFLSLIDKTIPKKFLYDLK